MKNPDERIYVITGERSPEEWQQLLHAIGSSGVSYFQVVDTRVQKLPPLPGEWPQRPLPIPYRLHEITSEEQYVSEEHIDEYWPLYEYGRGRRAYPISGVRGFKYAFNSLLHAKPKHVSQGIRLSPEVQKHYLASIGLDVVKPRVEAGFMAAEYDETLLYSCDTVVRAGSFIAYARSLKEGVSEKPKGITAPDISFFADFADYLERQIASYRPAGVE